MNTQLNNDFPHPKKNFNPLLFILGEIFSFIGIIILFIFYLILVLISFIVKAIIYLWKTLIIILIIILFGILMYSIF